MTTAERLRHLEDEIEWVKVILDGSEAQTREAVVVVGGLLVAFLKGKGLLDYDELITFLAEAAEPDYESEDHNGKLIHEMRGIVEFHKGLDAGTSKPRVPLDQQLTADEIAAIRTRAEAEVASERTANELKHRRSRKKRPRAASSAH